MILLKRFILDGIPRSGTTAVSTAINMHPNAFCAVERYQVFADHGACLLPATLGDPDVPPAFAEERHIPQVNVDYYHEQRRDLLTYGNKTPRYYFNALNICRSPRIYYLVIMRNPLEVCASWNARAGDTADAWQSDDVGLFAMLEYIQVCYVLATIDPRKAFVLSYDDFFFSNWQEAVRKLFDFLECPITGQYLSEFEQRLGGEMNRSIRISAQDHELDFFETAGLDRVQQFFRRQKSKGLSKFSTGYRDNILSPLANLDALVRTYFECAASYPNAATILQRILTDQSYFFARSRFQSFLELDACCQAGPHARAWLSIVLFYRTAFAASRYVYDRGGKLEFSPLVMDAIGAALQSHEYVAKQLDQNNLYTMFVEAYESHDPWKMISAADMLALRGLREDAQILRARASSCVTPGSYAMMCAAEAFADGEAVAQVRLSIRSGTLKSSLGMDRLREGFG